MTRIVVLGAGAMGCYFAGRLAESGLDPILVDIDDDRLAGIATAGVTVVDRSGRRSIPVRALRAEALEAPIDLIVLFTKAMHSAAAISGVAHLLDPDGYILTLQNGLGNPERIAPLVGLHRILVGVTDIPADLELPATVHSLGDGKIAFWSHDAPRAHEIQAVATLLETADFTVTTDPDVMIAVWEKVSFNAALNATTALLGTPVGSMACVDGRALIATICDEAQAVAAGGGILIDRARLDARIVFALDAHADHQPSMLQDRLARRPTEIDAINGAIVALGDERGIPTPVNRTLLQLVRMATR